MSDYGTPPGPAAIADRLAIQDILALHSRGLDRLDSQALKHCYWPEANVDYGAYKGPAHAFADIVVQVLPAQYELTRHGLGNTLIDFDGDSARTETCVSAGHLLQGAGEDLHFYGRYVDQFECRDGQWKILFRQVVMDWCKRHPVVDERQGEAFGDLAKGGHYPQDPLYPFLDNGPQEA